MLARELLVVVEDLLKPLELLDLFVSLKRLIFCYLEYDIVELV